MAWAAGLALAAGALVWTTGWFRSPREPSSRPADDITVAAFNFAESQVLAEIYLQTLRQSGFEVSRAPDMGPREIVEPALEQGVVDLVPEYLGTALEYLNEGSGNALPNARKAHATLAEAFAARGVTVLRYAPAQNQNGIAVTRETAAKLHLRSVSDLRKEAGRLVLGGPPECPQRPFCLPGLRSTYGLEFRGFQPLDAGGPLTVAALKNGDIDVAVLFTSDSAVRQNDFVLLKDDRRLQPAENVVPVISQELAQTAGAAFVRAVNRATLQLTRRDLLEFDRRAEGQGEDPRSLARDWLQERGILG